MPFVDAYRAGFMDKCAELGLAKSAALPNLLLNLPLAALSIPQIAAGASDAYHGVRDQSWKQTLGGVGNMATGTLGLAFGHHMAGKGLRDLGAGMRALKGESNALSDYVARGPMARYTDNAGGTMSRLARTAGGALMHPFWKADVAGMRGLNKLDNAPAIADAASRIGSHSSFNNPLSNFSGGTTALAAMTLGSPAADALSQSGAEDVRSRSRIGALRRMLSSQPGSTYNKIAPRLGDPLRVNVTPLDSRLSSII